MRIAITAFLLSLLGIPACYLFKWVNARPTMLFIYATLLLLAFVMLAYFAVVKKLPSSSRSDPFLYLFMLFAFTSVIDGVLASTVLGYTDVLDFYFDHGEPYMNTPHGLGLNVWDASFHLICYILMIHHLSEPKYKGTLHATMAGFVWCGSILNSLFLMAFAIPSGEHALLIQPSILLNVPFLSVPILYMIRLRRERREYIKQITEKEKIEGRTGMAAAPWLLLFLAFFVFVVAIRAHAAIGSPLSWPVYWRDHIDQYITHPSAYPRVQIMLLTFAHLPMLLASWLASDAAIASIVGGAMLQAGATMGIASLWDGGSFIAAMANLSIMLVGGWTIAWRGGH